MTNFPHFVSSIEDLMKKTIMTPHEKEQLKELIEGDTRFRYMMLSRLKTDCDHLGCGSLWGTTRDYHARCMVALWDSLKIKPKWLTSAQLMNLVYLLTHKDPSYYRIKAMPFTPN